MHYLIFFLLCLAIASSWVYRWPQAWLVPALLSIALALLNNLLSPIGLLSVAGLYILCILYSGKLVIPKWQPTSRLEFVLAFAIVTIGFLIATRVLPGFNKYLVPINLDIDIGMHISTLSFNYGKGLAGLFILAYCVKKITNLSQWKSIIIPTFTTAFVTACTVFAAAIWLDVVNLSPKFHWIFFLWALNNLFLTCIAEEVFFRGLLQHHCAKWLNRYTQYGGLIAIVLISSLFLLVHSKGGASYAVLAFMASIGYGWIYYKTKRIEASILTHFLINTIHILMFT